MTRGEAAPWPRWAHGERRDGGVQGGEEAVLKVVREGALTEGGRTPSQHHQENLLKVENELINS